MDSEVLEIVKNHHQAGDGNKEEWSEERI